MGLISRVSSRTYRLIQPCRQKKRQKFPTKPKKAKQKAVEDKTFGLKNKKGAKQQKFIEQVNKQAQNKYQNKGAEKAKEAAKSKKEQKQAYLDQLDAILKPVKSEREVLLSKKQQEADKEKEVVYLTIEELVEVERLKLKNSGKKLTPVTLESFLVWKKKKRAEKKAEEEKAAKTKTKYAKDGKIMSNTGKELFAYYKDKIDLNDDEEMAEDVDYNANDSDQEEEAENLKKQGGIREITAETFYYEGVDAAINEELFADCDLDELADELAELES